MHIPVLQKEVLEYLNPRANENFIDCTIGEGGHTAAIFENNSPNGKIMGIEFDSELYHRLRSRWGKILTRIILVNDSYANLKTIIRKHKFKQVNGILFDLGMSSWHLEESKKGFSFLRNEPLDMRYNSKSPLTAQQIVNQWHEAEIEKILKEYSQERFSKQISREIISVRKLTPIETTFQLVTIIKRAIPYKYQRRGIHPATKTFQALRITVNNELENLKKGLSQSLEILEPQGRLVVISFHSLEDRIVKNFFKEKSSYLEILTKKPIISSNLEIKINRRSRSAKLRAAIKI